MAMPISPLLCAAAATLAIAAAAPVAAQEGPEAPGAADPMMGEILDRDALTELMTDAKLSGCYADRIEPWSEETAKDGALFDHLRGGAQVGEWWIEQNAVCYFYTDPRFEPGPHCFLVRRRGDHHDFVGSEGVMVASTECQDVPSV